MNWRRKLRGKTRENRTNSISSDHALSLPLLSCAMTISLKRMKSSVFTLLLKIRTQSFQNQPALRTPSLGCLALPPSSFQLKILLQERAVSSSYIHKTILRSSELKCLDLSMNTQQRNQDVLAMQLASQYPLPLLLSRFFLRISPKMKWASLRSILTFRAISSK